MKKGKLLLPLLMVIAAVHTYGFNVQTGATYKLTTQLTFSTWNGQSCSTDHVLICSGNKVKVIRIIEGKAIIKAKTGRSVAAGGIVTCPNGSNKEGTYCIDQGILGNNVEISDILPQYGLMSVPFKYDLNSSRMYPGGQIGGLLGIQRRLNWKTTESITWSIVGTAGYSRLALNNSDIQNVDASNTRFADAFTYGFATGISFNRFQFMIVKGWDQFSDNGKKSNINWLMVGFGFGFIKPPSEE